MLHLCTDTLPFTRAPAWPSPPPPVGCIDVGHIMAGKPTPNAIRLGFTESVEGTDDNPRTHDAGPNASTAHGSAGLVFN
eukprot:scaffold3208_cov402-Prasinococcus_capsulatus_cf.AAC.1